MLLLLLSEVAMVRNDDDDDDVSVLLCCNLVTQINPILDVVRSRRSEDSCLNPLMRLGVVVVYLKELMCKLW